MQEALRAIEVGPWLIGRSQPQRNFSFHAGHFRVDRNWKLLDLNDREIGLYGIDQTDLNVRR